MIFGIGIDITEIQRISDLYRRHPQFLLDILTATEQGQFNRLKNNHAIEYLAGRFSAKEAYSKAFGTGIGSKITWLDIEIINNEQGRPIITKQPFSGDGHISISHTKDLVMTEVILENRS
ncbi:holo-ACP synthase [Periweissella beninensis]|uniref:Holo-[acyl-carrier-protein] synthase n=1 Tax=Periweissella beninensis TaxID=504936 RepID=A0ABT0VJ79_9LACO|nr:holo-ACP synthase [Periweissella beninensis]MBM7544421.1 holo-[acyl-carrier protein] synthase [Periweissella beninensis]MCM2437892.1 holo-ACP synthase [Periweissella beninensis]MCT4396750.1 holo-ACP synthase [Periweissella beninensis]